MSIRLKKMLIRAGEMSIRFKKMLIKAGELSIRLNKMLIKAGEMLINRFIMTISAFVEVLFVLIILKVHFIIHSIRIIAMPEKT